MILLGINCGLGNNDCAQLPVSALNLEAGWLNYPRPKTGIARECPLWPDTVLALREALAARPQPKALEIQDRVFVTRKGNTWEPKKGSDNPVSKEMSKLLHKTGLKRPGLNFYALRHTFQTIGAQTLDKDAIRYIMGHVEDAADMSAVYNEKRPSDDRLRKVTDHVRDWLRNTPSRPTALVETDDEVPVIEPLGS